MSAVAHARRFDARIPTGPAQVRRVEAEQVWLSAGPGQRPASLAVVGYTPQVGDRVLALEDDHGETWVVGVIHAPRLDAVPTPSDAVQQVHDREGQLLFTYDADNHRARLHAPADLELDAQGHIRLRAREGVHIEGPSVALVSSDAARETQTRVELSPDALTLSARTLRAMAEQGRLCAEALRFRSKRLEAEVERAAWVGEWLETKVGRLVERAVDVYREAEGLSQTRAGRLRLVAEKTVQLLGENALLKARDRMKIRGERIHLA